jgi:hypothetical protein
MASTYVSKLQLPWSTWPGGIIFTKFEKEATRQQFTELKLYRLLAIVLLLKLVPWDRW